MKRNNHSAFTNLCLTVFRYGLRCRFDIIFPFLYYALLKEILCPYSASEACCWCWFTSIETVEIQTSPKANPSAYNSSYGVVRNPPQEPESPSVTQLNSRVRET